MYVDTDDSGGFDLEFELIYDNPNDYRYDTPDVNMGFNNINFSESDYIRTEFYIGGSFTAGNYYNFMFRYFDRQTDQVVDDTYPLYDNGSTSHNDQTSQFFS